MTGKELYAIVSGYMKNATINRKFPMHLVSLATMGLDNSPRIRQVVLRQFCEESRSMIFHTDYRSPKAKEILENGKVEIMAYHPKDKVQMRFQARGIVHYQDEISKAAWEKLHLLGRKCYLTKHAPSTHLPEGFDEEDIALRNKLPPKEETEEGYNNFAAVECIIEKIDFLKLNIKGHNRYKIWFEEDNTPQTMIISP